MSSLSAGVFNKDTTVINSVTDRLEIDARLKINSIEYSPVA